MFLAASISKLSEAFGAAYKVIHYKMHAAFAVLCGEYMEGKLHAAFAVLSGKYMEERLARSNLLFNLAIIQPKSSEAFGAAYKVTHNKVYAAFAVLSGEYMEGKLASLFFSRVSSQPLF